MKGCCTECGKPLLASGQCSDKSCKGAAEALPHLSTVAPPPFPRSVGPLPKPSTARRLLGSGVEFAAYDIGGWVIAPLDSATGGLLGLLVLFLLALIVLRDFNAGAFSIAKRISQMRVVDRRSGKPASNTQALVRNGYYLGLLVGAVLLPWIDWITAFFFTLFVMLDVMMILASPRGLRLGDLLAGTQVIEARS